MAEKQLIYKSDARRAVLCENPSIIHCIDRIKSIDAVEVVYGQWIDVGRNIHGQKITQCNQCHGNSIEGGLFCRNCGANMNRKAMQGEKQND